MMRACHARRIRPAGLLLAVLLLTFFLPLLSPAARRVLANAPRSTPSPRCGLPWGVLPIVANEYWLGSGGICPYDHCGEPYSFVRDPAQPPPFSSTDGGLTWQRNACPDPYNQDTCQGPYEGYGENYGKAFALLGMDAKPNDGSMNPRSGIMLDSRYDAIADGGDWWYLVDDDLWDGPNTLAPINDGDGADRMAAVLFAGGYGKAPLPGAALEPPPAYWDDWSYCWDTPGPDTCFNYPAGGRTPPYETLQFLNGAKTSFWAKGMCEDNYMDGLYAPGQRVVVPVYNGYAVAQWGATSVADAAVLVGYFRAVIVGYGTDMFHPCTDYTIGDWQSFVHCIKGDPAQGNTLYALAETPLVLDPTLLFLPPNQAPAMPQGADPPAGATRVPLTATLSWAASPDPDGDPVTYDVAFGPTDPPPLVLTDVVTPTFDPGPLLSHTTYYWLIMASDCLSSTAGPVWSFTTLPVVWSRYLPVMCKPNCPVP